MVVIYLECVVVGLWCYKCKVHNHTFPWLHKCGLGVVASTEKMKSTELLTLSVLIISTLFLAIAIMNKERKLATSMHNNFPNIPSKM